MVLGIVGGSIGILCAVLYLYLGNTWDSFVSAMGGTSSSQDWHVTAIAVVGISIAIVGIVGGVLARTHPRAAAMCMTIALIAGVIDLRYFWVVPAILLLLGASLSFLGSKEKAANIAQP